MRLSKLNLPGRRLALCALPLALMTMGGAHAAPPDCVSGSNYDATTSCKLPAGVTEVKIEAWGGGGQGAGGVAFVQSGGGGGGGSYCSATFSGLAAETVLSINVGAGGAGLLDGGGASSVTGDGIVGLEAAGGKRTSSTTGGAGGLTTSCTAVSAVKHAGGAGANASGATGGGGGGSAGENGVGGNATNQTGGTGVGNGGDGATSSTSSTTGGVPGGGGGGGSSTGGRTSASLGAKGSVKLTFTLPPEDGVCGTAHKPEELVTTAPASELCSAGTASSVTAEDMRYVWTCEPIGTATESASCMVGRGYTVGASAVAHGSVDPASRVVRYAETAAFGLTADSGYRPTSASATAGCKASVSGNNLLVGDVRSDCSAEVSFSEVQTQSNIPTQKSGVTATVEVAGCTAVTNVAFTAAPAQGQPANTAFPFGLLGFTATGCTGGDADVWVTYSEAVPAGAKFYKLIGGSYQEYNHPQRPTFISGNTVQFRVTDGSHGDADGSKNGQIQDPAGVGVPSAGVVGIPTLSEWGMIILSGLLALGSVLTLSRRRV